MKLLLTCMECLKEQGFPSLDFSIVNFTEGGLYSLKCSKGHESITVLQQMKFEVLFEIGCHAILDGYYREAVSSFAVSLERFYEFTIKVLLGKSCSELLIEQGWKSISKQSERQLGAFIFIWMNHFQELPIMLKSKSVEFRNSVIHKGQIPTYEESIKYGDEVLIIINTLKKKLQKEYSKELQNLIFNHLRESTHNNNLPLSTMSISTIVSLSNGDVEHEGKNLEKHLESLRIQREHYKSLC